MQTTMPPPALADKLRAYIALRKARPPLSNREICAALGVTRQTLWRWEKKLAELRRENSFQ